MPDGNNFVTTLPEAVRGNAALADVKDAGDLATRYVAAVTPKPIGEQLPAELRGHEAFKDVKDLADLATRHVKAVTPRPLAEQLPEDIRADASFKDIKDLGGLARSFLNAQKKLGVPADQLLRIPAKGDEKGWDEFYGRLGRPESPDKYALTPPKGKEWNEDDKAFHNAMLPILHKMGATQEQADAISQAFRSYGEQLNQKLDQAVKAKIATATKALKDDWGAAYDQRLGRGVAGLAYFAKEAGVKLEDLGPELDRGELGNRPALLKVLDHIGNLLEEDGLIGRAEGTDGAKSPVEAQQAIAAKRADKEFQKAYRDKRHPGHADAVKEMQALYQQAYPDNAA